MTTEEEYEVKLIFRAFNWALVMHGEKVLRENPGLLLLEMESLRNMDLFDNTSVIPFKDYNKMLQEKPNLSDKFTFDRPPKIKDLKWMKF